MRKLFYEKVAELIMWQGLLLIHKGNEKC